MEITKDLIEDRLRTLRAQRDQVIANGNALTGAIQQCEWFLQQLEEVPAEEPKFEKVEA